MVAAEKNKKTCFSRFFYFKGSRKREAILSRSLLEFTLGMISKKRKERKGYNLENSS